MVNPLTEPPESFPSAFSAFLTENTIICGITDDAAVDPGTVSEARNSKYWNEWLAAMHEELQSLNPNVHMNPYRTYHQDVAPYNQNGSCISNATRIIPSVVSKLD
jgi:hypothetical protein